MVSSVDGPTASAAGVPCVLLLDPPEGVGRAVEVGELLGAGDAEAAAGTAWVCVGRGGDGWGRRKTDQE